MRWFRSLTLALLAALLSLSAAHAQRCAMPLVAFGPPDPSHGFPKYYLDSNNLALGPCLDLVCDPALPVPNPTKPVHFPDNFPDEFFYQLATATLNGPNGEVFDAEWGLEGSFLNAPTIANGDQMVFTRFRLRATGVQAGGSYTITHPFGVETLVADGTPPRLINFTRDTGIVPLAFNLALNGDLGPFLTFLAGPVPPPPGTIGQPAANQTVTGSACGTNFVKIEGPGLPAGGIQTDQFTLIGKIAFICGNGTVDPGEQCDDGNIVAGDCCSPSCQFESAGSACEDGNPCTANGTCDGAGVCQVGAFTTAACDDGNACTTGDRCDGAGHCAGGPALSCDDGNSCTTDACDPQTGTCSHKVKPNGATCSDGNACTQTDTCQVGVCKGGKRVVCSALDQCHTAGVCDPNIGACTNPPKPNGVVCNDGLFCTVNDACTDGVCGGNPLNCSAAGNQCNDGVCDEASNRCLPQPKPDGLACNDNNACTQTDACHAGVCQGAPIVCVAPDTCHAAGTCQLTTGTCTHPALPNGRPCDDGNACTQTDTCQAGVCRGTNSIACAAPDQCHDAGVCDPATGACSNPPKADGTSCDDGNLCTQADTCQAGSCTGSVIVCSVSDQCHDAGTCDPTTGHCSNPAKPEGSACNDGNPCTQTDTCRAGTCVGASPVTCTASDPCHSAGTCDPATGACSDPPKQNGTTCDDGNACTGSDTCQSGVCTGGTTTVCVPSDQCHDAGTCNPATGSCSNPAKPDGSACSDGNACTRTDGCESGVCIGANPLACPPPDACHEAGVCDPATGTCSYATKPDGSACSDGNACTQTDTCQAGVCRGTDPVACAASNQCHAAGVCDPLTGACSNPVKPDGAGCTDGNACTRTDTCESGVCVGTNPLACPPPDACHEAGVCDPATGTCSYATKPDGSACSDGNPCTQTDTCQAGVCRGTNPVACAASDQCHAAGVCDPLTGACSNPVKPDGATCTDGSLCTRTDTCQAGVCRGSDLVVCAASDQCHDVGTCDRATGICSNPAKADGTACDDGAFCTVADACTSGVCRGIARDCSAAGDQCNDGGCNEAAARCERSPLHDGTPCSDGDLCTQNDACRAGVCGGTPIVCSAQDQCHGIGVCDPATGSCTNPFPDGIACDDGQFCTVNDTCRRGVCRGTLRDCSALADQCNGGVCNEATEQCERAPKREGTLCNDGDACTRTDTCQAGACAGADPVQCVAPDGCHGPGTCDPRTGNCSNPSRPDGTPCDDGSACTLTDTCVQGVCLGGAPPDCDDSNPCTEDSCDPAGGCQHAVFPDGTSCSDGNACTLVDTCRGGTCKGGSRAVCTASDQCHAAGVCDPATGACSNPATGDGSPCSDGDPCTQGDSCRAGTCSPGAAVVCAALDQCHSAGICDPATGSCSNPEISCDDGDPCTVDSCLPESGCVHAPATSFASVACVFAANREACPADTIPAAVVHASSEAQQQIDQATAADSSRRAKLLLRKAAKKLASAAQLVSRAGKKKQISPACTAALRGLYLDAKARAETMARELKHKT